MIRREVHIFMTAVMFYTRIPCPAWVDHRPEFLSLSTRYFPLIGWIVGGLYALSILVFTTFLPLLPSVLLGLSVSIWLTGAFHEDGFADVCDGFGGGWTKEKILAIMKDSRLGTYGVTGLVLMLGLKVACTLELWPLFTGKIALLFLLISSHTLSRMMAVLVIYFQPYAREDQEGKAKPVATGISLQNGIVAWVLGMLPFLAFLWQTTFLYSLAIIPLLLLTLYLMRYFKKWIGGYTGDCLGAVQQLSEIVFLLSILILWKFT